MQHNCMFMYIFLTLRIVCSMDANILRIILQSCNEAENIIQCENYNNISKETLLCIQSDTILNTLCVSLSNLLYYKISKEVYQRYSIRLLVIVC